MVDLSDREIALLLAALDAASIQGTENRRLAVALADKLAGAHNATHNQA